MTEYPPCQVKHGFMVQMILLFQKFTARWRLLSEVAFIIAHPHGSKVPPRKDTIKDFLYQDIVKSEESP